MGLQHDLHEAIVIGRQSVLLAQELLQATPEDVDISDKARDV